MKVAQPRSRVTFVFLALIICGLIGCEGTAPASDSDDETDEKMTNAPESPFMPVDPKRTLYVIQGGRGNQTGIDWANAISDLPDSPARGYTYMIADGTYRPSGFQFDVSENDEQWVFFVKAEAQNHGSEEGWDTSLGDGYANLGTLLIRQGRLFVSGGDQRRIRINGDFANSVVQVTADNVYLDSIEIDGGFETDQSGRQLGGACTGVSVEGDSITILNSIIHSAADDGVAISNSSQVYFGGNTIVDLANCGTDNGCGPCYNGHSDGIELYAVTNSAFIGNYVRLDEATACVFFANWDSRRPNKSLLFANNVFYKNGGFIAYFQDFEDLSLVNNTMWGVQQGRFGGVSIGKNAVGLEIRNNVILSINYEYQDSDFNGDLHDGDFNLLGVELASPNYGIGPNDIVEPNPGFIGVGSVDGPFVPAAQAIDFEFTKSAGAVDSGTPIESIDRDFHGVARPLGGGWDIGAFEQHR